MTATPPRARAVGIAAVVAALAIVVGSVGCLSSIEPVPSPGPSGAPPIAGDDRVPLAVDGEIDDDGLYHDSRDDLYRTPFGAVTAGTEVTLRLRASAGDLA